MNIFTKPIATPTITIVGRNRERKKSYKRDLGHETFVPSHAFVLHVSWDSPTHPLPPFLGSGLVQVLIRVPPPHVLEHALKAENPPCTGANTIGTVTVSLWVNPLMLQLGRIARRVREQPHKIPQTKCSHSQLQHVQTHITSRKARTKTAWPRNDVPLQACVLHVSCDSPTHPLPPFLGSGLVHVLIRAPPPHVLEHPLKGENPPCTGTDSDETVSSWVNEWRHDWMRWITKPVSK